MRRDAAGDDALQQGDELGADNDGVNASFGHGGVSAFAAYGEVVGVGIGAGHAVFDVEDADGRGGKKVLAVDEVEVIEVAGGDHFPRAARQFFLGVLEDGVDFAAELVVVIIKIAAGGHQDGGVAVVTAGVHFAVVHRAEGQVVALFLDGQGVYVGAQADFGAGFAGGKDDDDTGRGQAFDAACVFEFAHFFGNEAAGFHFFEGEFGMLVQVTAPCGELLQVLFHCGFPGFRGR